MKRIKELFKSALVILVIWVIYSVCRGYINISFNIPIDNHLLIFEAMILNRFYDWIKSVKKGQ